MKLVYPCKPSRSAAIITNTAHRSVTFGGPTIVLTGHNAYESRIRAQAHCATPIAGREGVHRAAIGRAAGSATVSIRRGTTRA